MVATWRSVRRRLAAVVVVPVSLGAAAAGASGQELRTVELSRQRHDSLPLQVELEHDGGKLLVQPAAESLLYRARVSYDPSRSEALYRYDAGSRLLRIGIRRPTTGATDGPRAPELRLELSNRTPVGMRLSLNSGNADLDLGGLRLTRLVVQSGASAGTIHFDTPNGVPMELLDLSVGAAALQLRGVANSRVREVRVTVGAGSAELDFGGEWTSDVDAELNVSLGRVRMRIPADVGIRVEASRFLASFGRDGLTQRGDAWYSANWDTAAHRIRIRSRTILGSLELDHGS